MAELYKTIDELIEKEKNPADYCFDEAWLIWLDEKYGLRNLAPKGYQSKYVALSEMLKTPEYSADVVVDYYVRIACAATEIGERLYKAESGTKLKRIKDDPNCYFGYGADFGHVKKSMYAFMTKDNSETDDCLVCGQKDSCEIYSKDTMTNFFYVLKMAIAFIEPSLLGKSYTEIELGCYFHLIGNQHGRIKDCFCKFFPLFETAIKIRSEQVGHLYPSLIRLQKQFGEFAKRSCQIGNYECILRNTDYEKSLNQRKGGVDNDQFALFAEWIEEQESVDPERVMCWKRDMLLEDVWNVYLDASKQYKLIFDVKDPLMRIITFTSYLEMINSAIKKRSEQIVKTIKGPKESESTQAK